MNIEILIVAIAFGYLVVQGDPDVPAHPMINYMRIRFFPLLRQVELSCNVKNTDKVDLSFNGNKLETNGDKNEFRKSYDYNDFNAGEYKCKIDTAEAIYTLKAIPSLKAMIGKRIIELAIIIKPDERVTIIELESFLEDSNFVCKKNDIEMDANMFSQKAGGLTKGFEGYLGPSGQYSCSIDELDDISFEVKYEEVFPKIKELMIEISRSVEGPKIDYNCLPLEGTMMDKTNPVMELRVKQEDKLFTPPTAILESKLTPTNEYECVYKNDFGLDVAGFKLDLSKNPIILNLAPYFEQFYNNLTEEALIKLEQEANQLNDTIKGMLSSVIINAKIAAKSIDVVYGKNEENTFRQLGCTNNGQSMKKVLIAANEKYPLNEKFITKLWLGNDFNCDFFYNEKVDFSLVRKGFPPIINKFRIDATENHQKTITCVVPKQIIDYEISLHRVKEDGSIYKTPVKIVKNANELVYKIEERPNAKWACISKSNAGSDEVIITSELVSVSGTLQIKTTFKYNEQLPATTSKPADPFVMGYTGEPNQNGYYDCMEDWGQPGPFGSPRSYYCKKAHPYFMSFERAHMYM